MAPEAVYLLHILWKKNTYEHGKSVLSDTQVFDAGKADAFLDLLPPGPGRDFAIQQLSKLPVPGVDPHSNMAAMIAGENAVLRTCRAAEQKLCVTCLIRRSAV